MKKVIPNIGDRFTYTFSSMDIPEEVPDDAVKHKLDQDRVFEIELFSQAEMRKLRNNFRRELQRRGVEKNQRQIDEVFDQVMKEIAKKIDLDFNKRGVGHVIGEDRRSRGPSGRDSQEWFYVINWPGGRKVREQFGFEDADFHITLGMTGNGVDEYRKDEMTILDKESFEGSQQGLKTLFVDDDDRRGFTDE